MGGSRYLYGISNELTSTISIYGRDEERGGPSCHAMERHNNGKAPLNKGLLLGYPRKGGNGQDKFQEHLINRFY